MKPLGDGDDVRVGPYRLLAELGRGGMGRVYLAVGPDGRPVAVKRIDPGLAGDKGFRGRFRREVTASRLVSGAHTAAVVDADPDASTPWLASVYVPGPSLREALDEAGPLPAEPALRLAARLASALVDIHRAGLVHRDLKPSNVLLTDDGPLVIDFGIVRAVDGTGGRDMTLDAWRIGSPAYMSPEQARGESVTPASDMFGLGVVLIEACTGTNPFAVAGDMGETLRNILRAEADLSALPERLRPIVARCLAKKPGARPTPAEVLAAVSPVPPSLRPWPEAVHGMIARTRGELSRLLGGTPRTTATAPAVAPAPPPAHPGPVIMAPTRVGTPWPTTVGAAPPAPVRVPAAPPPRNPLRWLAAGGVAMVLVAAILISIALSPDGETSGQGSDTAVEEPSGPITGYGDKCLDVYGGKAVDSAPVVVWTCNGMFNQDWTIAADGTLRSLDMCLDVSYGSTGNGSRVQLYTCNGTAAQQWVAQDGQLINPVSGRCLDATDWNTADGTQTQIWDCTGWENQQWSLPS